MLRIRPLFIIATLLALFSVQSAAQGQFYFVAKKAPLGSLSTAGQNTEAVYIRWGLLEGDMPEDIASIRLTRNGQTLFETNLDADMTAEQIQALYQGEAQARRMLETLSRLQEFALQQGEAIDLQNFGVHIKQRLSADPYFRLLAPRLDFNIARALHQGYLDVPGSGVFDYELLALSTSGQSARLGFVQLDTDAANSVLPAMAFKQVLQSTCDVPESAKDHHTVALNWQEAFAGNQANQLATQVFVSGYDLYRGTSNLDASVNTPPARDLAALAALSGHDTRGDLLLSGLEKINDLPLSVNPDGSDQPEWVETYDQLLAAGLAPGDRRAYYLVPRDFTGNYGPTVATIVTVPDLLRPPTPWDINLFADQGAETENLSVTWDAINFENFSEQGVLNTNICNSLEAQRTGRVAYVNQDQQCDLDVQRETNLNIAGYRVYRFEDFQTASAFSDSDGDGVADAVERESNLQCDAQSAPAGASSFRVDTPELEEVTLSLTNRKIVKFRDVVPAADKGAVYWYRLAAVTEDGRPSLLSGPIRALFPDRDLPSAPVVTHTKPSREICSCESFVDQSVGPFGVNFNVPTNAKSPTFSCGAIQYQPDFDEFDDFVVGACAGLLDGCGVNTPIDLDFRLPAVGASCTTTVSPQMLGEICSEGGINSDVALSIGPQFCDTQVPVLPGDVTEGNSTITVETTEPGTCVSLHRDFGDTFAKVASSCGETNPDILTYTVESGLFCGYAVSHDENNNISTSTTVPCSLVAQRGKTPSPPQITNLHIDVQNAWLSWRSPVEPMATTLIELRQTKANGEESAEVFSVPVAGQPDAGIQNKTFDIDALVGDSDRWCARMKTVGIAQDELAPVSSDWSGERCEERYADARQPPDYLTWPTIPAVPQDRTLVANNTDDLLPPFALFWPEEVRAQLSDLYTNYIELTSTEIPFTCLDGYDAAIGSTTQFVLPVCSGEGPSDDGKLNAVLAEHLNFQIFRQRQLADQSTTDWVQVSPLIDYAHWETEGAFADFLVLFDPFIKVIEDNGRWTFVVIDRYPLIPGEFYRYQLVWYTDDHRISRWRQSRWIEAQPDTAAFFNGTAAQAQ